MKTPLLMILAFLLSILSGLSSCRTDSVLETSFVVQTGTVTLNDATEDVSIGYIDIDTVTFDYTEDTIDITFELYSLPSQLLFNSSAIDDWVFIYSWDVYIDLDKNGEIGKGDLGFLICHYKDPDKSPETLNILDGTREDYGEFENDLSTFGVDGSLSYCTSQVGNTFVMSIPRNEDSRFNKLGPDNSVLVQTTYNSDSGESYSDQVGDIDFAYNNS